MSKSVPVVNTASQKFQDVFTALNTLIGTLNTEIVTANSSSAGGLTVGNCMVSGILGAITVAANTFRGGTVAVPGPLTFSSNVTVNTSFSFITGNTVINSTSISVGANVVLNASSLSLGNAGSIAVGLSLINSTAVQVGNSTVFGTINSSALYIQNTISTTVISPGGISVGNSVVNAAFGSAGVDPSDLTFITFGDATANAYANSTIIRIANTTSSAVLRPTSLTVGSSVIHANGSIFVGNSVSNLVINSSGVSIDGVPGGAFTTGDAKITLKTVADVSWVMMNDGTIGDPTSGANRANTDCMALYTLLWNNISNTYAPVYTAAGAPTSRGVLALTDWANHKRLGLPRVLGRALVVAGTGLGLTGRELGAWLGEETHAMTVAEMPSHGHTIADPGHNHAVNDPTHVHGLGDPGHAHGVADPQHLHIDSSGGWSHMTQVGDGGPGASLAGGIGMWYNNFSDGYAYTGIGIYNAGTGMFMYANYTGVTIANKVTNITINPIGSSTPFNVMQPSTMWNIMIKL